MSQPIDQPIRVLVVDDDELDRQAIRRHLHTAGVDAVIEEMSDAGELVARVDAEHFDCIILDYHLPGETAIEVIGRVMAAGLDTPILCITGQDEEVGAATVAAGALDFLAKVDLSPSRLTRRLRYVLRLSRAEAQSRRARADLDAQRRLLDAVIEQLPTGVVVIDPERAEILVANARATEALGPVGVELFTATSQPVAGLARKALAEAIASGTAVTIDGTVNHQGRELRIGARPVITDRAVAVVVLDDVTDEVAARRAAERAARAREAMMGIVSHDLRGPLSAIGVALDGLRDAGLDDKTRDRYLNAVQRSVARADRLIRDLLFAHQIEVGKVQVEPRSIAIKALLEQVARDHELVANQDGVTLVVAVGDDVDRVWADRDRLGQAFGNLVENAFRHGRGSATIELGARRDDAGAVLLTVRDHGPGIADDVLPQVFDRYAQGRTRRGGAGLGLAIVRGIAQAHGGDATVANHPEGGAVFTIELPPAPAP